MSVHERSDSALSSLLWEVSLVESGRRGRLKLAAGARQFGLAGPQDIPRMPLAPIIDIANGSSAASGVELRHGGFHLESVAVLRLEPLVEFGSF